MTANVPNWKSGDVAEVARYRDFYSKSDPKDFFIPIHIASIVCSLSSLVLVWRADGLTRALVAGCVVVAIGVFAWTVAFFVPINDYIWNAAYEPALLKEMVAKWVRAQYVRVAIVGAGLAMSIWALESFRLFAIRRG